MRPPQRPPTGAALLRLSEHGLDRVQQALALSSEPLVNNQYLHWDELRRRQPPGDLAREEWWFGLKLRREQLYQPIPLSDKNGNRFKFALVPPIPQRLHEIDQGGGGVIHLPEQITNSNTRDQFYVASLMQEAITSSQIEGASTTRKVAKELLRTGRAPRDRSEQMIFNNYTTMRRISDLKDEPLSKQLVFDIHEIITSDTLDAPDEAGRFRAASEPVKVYNDQNEILHDPPHALELESRMEAMCAFANGESNDGFVHPVIRSIVLHFWLAYDHPFVDGNGRVARALFYWSMLKYGYWLIEFISISRIIQTSPVKYSRAFLYSETDDNDLTYFILFHNDVIVRAFAELHQYVQRKSNEVRAVEHLIQKESRLNHRQRALLGHAIRHPDAIYSIESHRKSHEVVYQTSRTDLLGLKDLGYLVGDKIGQSWTFKPVRDLQRKLAEPD